MLPSQHYRQPDAGAVLSALHDINTRHGYLPADEVRRAASDLAVPVSVMYSAATFYALFSFKPGGQHKLQVCESTACYVKGAAELLTKLQSELGIQIDQTTEDLLFTLKCVRCVGSCGLAPMVRVDDETFGRLTLDDVNAILKKYRDEPVTSDK